MEAKKTPSGFRALFIWINRPGKSLTQCKELGEMMQSREFSSKGRTSDWMTCREMLTGETKTKKSTKQIDQ